MLIKGELRFIETLKKMEQFNPDRLEEIEKALKRGEKYEAMWREVKEYPESHKSLVLPDKYRGYQGGALKYIIETTEQKYFPEPKPELVELARKIDKEVRELLNMLGG